MTTVVASRFIRLERGYARCLGAKSHSLLAKGATEAQLQVFPPTSWCASQEANVAVMDRLRSDPRWAARLARLVSTEQINGQKLDRLIAQIFVMTWGRRLASLRLCFAMIEGPIVLVTDLPRALVNAFLSEFGGRVVDAPVRAFPLRTALAMRAGARLLARHVLRLARLLALRRLPTSAAGDYVAWLGALPAEVDSAGGDRLSLLAFLDESRESTPALQVVVQGAIPRTLPAGIEHRRHLPPLRVRPSWFVLWNAVTAQCRCLLRDLASLADFRCATLTAVATFDIPALRCWFRTDPPRAVLYANHQIGGESPVALMDSPVPSMMVFYSSNVAYRPINTNAPGTRLEPEMRYIVADFLTMWSPEMTAGFLTAGYERERLVETGPIFFGRQETFRSTSRFVTGRSSGPTRIGIFDVAVLRPSSRFAEGFGLLTYSTAATQKFFGDVFTAARDCFGGELVIVRKMKRAYHRSFGDDVDFSALPSIEIERHDPGENLWRLLEQVDLVLCMPFTSVAYLADECGIPAAYYDPRGDTEASPLGGRAPLLSGPAGLQQWLRAPAPPPPRLPRRVAPLILAAATRTLAAAGAPHTFWESVEECRSH